MSEVTINVTKRTLWGFSREGIFPKKLSEVIINITTKSLAGEF